MPTTLGDNFRVIIEGGMGARFASLAEDQAERAESARDTAMALVGNMYTSQALGEAATTTGQTFAVENGDGTITVRRRTAGSSVVVWYPAHLDAEGRLAINLASTTDAQVQVKTDAGVGLERGVAIEHYADAVGAYGLDIHQYQGAKQAAVIHCYSDENGSPSGAIALQIDHTRTGSMLVLKNAENPVTSPGTRGTADFAQGIGYGGPLSDTLQTLWTWRHDNVVLVPSRSQPINFNSVGGTKFTTGELGEHAVVIAQGEPTKYSLVATGVNFGATISTSGNNGFALVVSKSATGAGTAMIVSNNGTGMTAVWANGAFGQVGGIDKDGNVYVGTDKVVGARGAAVADASGGATVDTEARAAINAILARLRAHGMIAT